MLVTTLQFDDIIVRCCFKLWVTIESLFSVLVERLQVTDLGWVVEEVREVQVEFTDQHTELSAPITNVIDALHVEAHELKDAANTVTLDR